jgi:adenylate cyclase
MNIPMSSARTRRLRKDLALRRAEMLLEVSRRCAMASRIDDVLVVLLEITTRELDCDRATLFLNDATTGELFSRVAQGDLSREIRILNNSGIAGHAFQTGEALIITDPYADPRFNESVDERTGYITRNILCVPVRTMAGETIGVMQCLNKFDGDFTGNDMELLKDITSHTAIALQSLLYVEHIDHTRIKEMAFLEMVSEISAELNLSALLNRVVAETTHLLGAERATIFLHDPASNTLFSRVASGAEINEIRFPSHLGIAGAVFTSAATMNIPYAYADLRFNPTIDRQTGFFTRSILCVPIVNKRDRVIGVTQVLNKKGSVFTDEDEQRLKAFTAQIAIALENSKLYDDVRRMKSYNDSILQSMSNGVITLDPEGKVVTCNPAGGRVLGIDPATLVGREFSELLDVAGQWVIERLATVKERGEADLFPDAALAIAGVEKSVNLTLMPLLASEGTKDLGSMLMFEDISGEKRMKSTLSRYMDPVIASRMLEGNALDLLGGVSAEATIMFTDVRGFTTITEEYGAQGTVSFLNEYFSLMVDCISKEGGMLDKFIGDAIMACFGLPIGNADDPDRATRTALAMISEMWRWNAIRREHGLKTVDMGVGLNTGIVVSGNIGSPKRMDYTVIGDGVNLAARLESACKAYSARILASESTVAKLRGTYRMRDIDLVVVKGKTQPVRVFELLDYHDAETFPNMADVLGHFADGMADYRAGKWDRAIGRFENCLRLNPGDALSKTYIGRCETLRATPPTGDWNGVWVMKDK